MKSKSKAKILNYTENECTIEFKYNDFDGIEQVEIEHYWAPWTGGYVHNITNKIDGEIPNHQILWGRNNPGQAVYFERDTSFVWLMKKWLQYKGQK